RAHVNDAAQAEQRAHRRSRDPVLAGAGFGDDAALAHSSREQDLAESVVDLVRPSVREIFAFQENLCAACVRAQSLRMKQRCRPAAIIAAQLFQLAPEIRLVSRVSEFARQFFERRDERFRYITTTE